MKNLDKLQKQLESIKTEIDGLSVFRDTPFLRKFRRQLEGEKSVIIEQIKEITQTAQSKEQNKVETIATANRNRSTKMTRSWSYFRSIRENYFPDKSLREIRSAYSRFRKGLETDISDVVWRNPSP